MTCALDKNAKHKEDSLNQKVRLAQLSRRKVLRAGS